METIEEIFSWWYAGKSLYHDLPNGFIVSFYITSTLSTLVYIYGCLAGEFKDEKGCGRIIGFLLVVLVGAFATLLIGIGGPIIIIISVVIGIGYILEKIGDCYRNGIKDKESKRLTALAELINSDPQFKAQYDELMKTTPKI